MRTTRPSVTHILLKAGADPGLAGRDGVTALEDARSKGPDEVVEILPGPGLTGAVQCAGPLGVTGGMRFCLTLIVPAPAAAPSSEEQRSCA